MTSLAGIVRTFLVSALLLVGGAFVATAQAPPFQRQWGTLGDGPGELREPWGIAVDPSGNWVYVADHGNHRIQKFTTDGVFIAQWGSAGPGSGQFSGPDAVTVDVDGAVYVADHDNRLVQKFDPNGVFLGQWATVVRAIAARDHRIYATDDFNGVIKVFDPDGTLLESLQTHLGGDNQYPAPWGIALDQRGFIYFADLGSSRLKSIINGVLAYLTGGLSGWDLQWLACDPDARIYTVTSFDGGGSIYVFNDAGHDIASWGTNGSGPGQFNRPRGVAVDASFNVYVADSGNNRIQKFGFGPTPVHSSNWGQLKRAYR